MKKFLLLTMLMAWMSLSYAQDSKHPLITEMPVAKDGKIHRCAFDEYEAYQYDKYPNKATTSEFEQWMSKEVKKYRAQNVNKTEDDMMLITIPTVVHVIHRGEAEGSGTNVAQELIDDQIKQLNSDFQRLSGTIGFNDDDDGINVMIEFCPVVLDPDNEPLAQPGINRVNAITSLLGAGVYTIAEFDMVVKEQTQWNPDEYFNFWSADLGGGVILGYAQFPDYAEMEGISGGGTPEHDGVVCLHTTVGGENHPGPNGAYGLGRTGTHEVGHWLGLRHIWGDGDCDVDDFCTDTPRAGGSNDGGCQTDVNSCNDEDYTYESLDPNAPLDPNDQANNYMDYSADACFDMFTVQQSERMRIIMGATGVDVPRRWGLRTSPKCQPLAPFVSFDGTETLLQETTTCTVETIEIDIRIDQAPSANADVTVSVNPNSTATEGKDFALLDTEVQFTDSDTDNKIIRLEIYHDGEVESTETIELDLQVNANNGDAQLATNNSKHIITLKDDDYAPVQNTLVEVTKLDEGFDNGMDGWEEIVVTGTDNSWTVGSLALTDAENYAHIEYLGTYSYFGEAENKQQLVQDTDLDATGLENLVLEFDWFCLGEVTDDIYDFGSIVVSTDGGTTYQRVENSLLLHSAPYAVVNAPQHAVFNLPESLNNSTFRIGFEWFNDVQAGTLFQPLAVDNVTIKGKKRDVTPIQTVIDTDSKLVFANQTVHFYGASGNVIATIINGNQDLGCTEVKVLSDGGATNIDFSSHTANAEAASKTIEVIPSQNGSSASYDISLYYTDTEIDAWVDDNSGVTANDFNIFKTSATVAAATTTNTDIVEVTPTAYTDFDGTTGKIYTASFTGFSTFGGANVTTTGTVPVELVSFTGKGHKNSVVLDWLTASELNTSHFVVERATEAKGFTALETVATTAKNSEVATYQLVDNKPVIGNNIYRLKIVDVDGQYVYSNTIVVKFEDNSIVSNIFPNPAKDVVFVNLRNTINTPQIIVRNYLGQVMNVAVNNNGRTIELATNNLASGTYFIEIKSDTGSELKRVVINR